VLGGYSFGVLVALELALRLERMGRQVPLLVAFDGFAPGHPKLMPLGERLGVHAREFARRGRMGRIDYVRDRIENIQRRFRPVVEDAVFTPPDVLDAEMNARLRRVADRLFEARERYRPRQRAHCDVLLLKASIPFDWPGSTTDPLYGWRDFVHGRIDTQIVPGEHLQLFRTENDQLLAELVRERLQELSID
jgi:thioesterase domain-containing protein